MFKYLLGIVFLFVTAAVFAEPPSQHFLLADLVEHNQLMRADEFVAIGYGHPETRAPIPDELRAPKTASKIFKGATLISLEDNSIVAAPPVIDEGYGRANTVKVYRSSAGVPPQATYSYGSAACSGAGCSGASYGYSAGGCSGSGGSCSASATGPIRRILFRPFGFFRRR